MGIAFWLFISAGYLQMGDSSNVAVVGDRGDADAIGKAEGPSHDGTPSSIESDVEQDAGAENTQEPTQPQKRKGGRKPVFCLLIDF